MIVYGTRSQTEFAGYGRCNKCRRTGKVYKKVFRGHVFWISLPILQETHLIIDCPNCGMREGNAFTSPIQGEITDLPCG
jgi:predicted RNA-binding Zn-ribbon protein involved in translation (DUF1610 family)